MTRSQDEFKGLSVIVLGTMGQIPFAGMAWQMLHYLEGFRRLGCEVAYVEDTGAWPYDAEKGTVSEDPAFTLRHLAKQLEWCGLGGAWAYRAVSRDNEVFGPLAGQWRALFADADVLVNVTAATVLRDEHFLVPCRMYLETDPVRPQIEMALGKQSTVDFLAMHTHHFTFGENLGAPDCRMPAAPFHYRTTRQPIVLDWWEQPPPAAAPPRRLRFSTIASWKQTEKNIEWEGETYTWSKDVEFRRFMDLPRHAPVELELALAVGDREAVRELASHGWHVRDALALSGDMLNYRDYLQGSDGEFTVAKEQYYRPRSGWFSDRSACFLAAGLPVVTQDTAFGNILPAGEGLFAFRDQTDILAALEAIVRDYPRHCRAARAIAREYFDAPTVVSALLDAAMTDPLTETTRESGETS